MPRRGSAARTRVAYAQSMAIKRMDNVAIVVEDVHAATQFFEALGMAVEGSASVEGPWVDGVLGLTDVRSHVVVLVTPDGHSRVELAQYERPTAVTVAPPVANTLGLTRIMFAVDDIDDAVASLEPHGASVLGRIEQYEDAYRLCYLRGPAGIIVALAEPLQE